MVIFGRSYPNCPHCDAFDIRSSSWDRWTGCMVKQRKIMATRPYFKSVQFDWLIHQRRQLFLCVAGCALSLCLPVHSARAEEADDSSTKAGVDHQLPEFEGSLNGIPALRDLNRKTLADIEVSQCVVNELLHVRI